MFYIKLFLFVIWMILLSPLRLFVSCIMRLCWFPGYKETVNNNISTNINDFHLDVSENFDIQNDGDGAKFIGMLTWLSTQNNQFSIYKTELKNILLSFCDSAGEYYGKPTFLRYPLNEVEKNESASNFSGDMMSGMLLGLHGIYNDLTNIERKEIINIFDIITNNFFTCYHPSDNSRGRIITWWAFGHEWIQIKAFLKVCTQYTKDISHKKYIKYSILYYLMCILAIPSRFCPDYGLFLGKFYMVWWYASHSTALYATILKDSKTLSILANRYTENLDILVLHRYITKSNKNETKILKLLNEYGYFPDIVDLSSIEYMNYYSLRSFESKRKSKYILPIYMRSHKYNWEQSPIDVNILQNKHYYDFIFPYLVWTL